MIFIRIHTRENGASDGSRTHNLLHGKQMLYQLSYTRTRVVRDSIGKSLIGKWILAFEVINDHTFAACLEDFFHKLYVQRMCLICILHGSVFKNQVKGNLVRLIDHITMAAGHLATVIMQHARARLEILFCAGEELLGGVGDIGFGPENNYV